MLENLKGLADLKKLKPEQLPTLCEEIRQVLIDLCQTQGGHLSSNLGVVELTVALHYVFPEDSKIVFDVGHQCYVHKILTGRLSEISTIRKLNGLSGFCDPSESPFDATVSGHASTSISQALGLTASRDLNGETHKVVAVVGDGALTGGLTYEALNNIKEKNDLLIVLNDNNMSINKNVGGLSKNVSKIRVGKYDQHKEKLKKNLNKLPLLGKSIYKFLRWTAHRLKWMILKNNYFEVFDLKYIGIIDGHDMKELLYYLTKIKNNVKAPTVLHIATKKGKGFLPAEENPTKFHSLTGSVDERVSAGEIVGETLTELAETNEKIVAITAAMTDGVGLNKFAEAFPERFFDVGIAEAHAVTFSSGLALGGMKPYVAIYSTFLQRAFDQLIHDIALSNLPVTFLLDRAGLVGSDGKTHQGLHDLSYLSNIPNFQVWTPFSNLQLKQMLEFSASSKNPIAIRYSKVLSTNPIGFDFKWNILQSGAKVKLLAVGANLVENCLEARNNCKNKVDVEVVAVTTVKPLDNEYLSTIQNCTVVTLEENQLAGGFGSLVSQHFASRPDVKVLSLGVDDKFVSHATIAEQLQMFGLDATSITQLLNKMLN